MLIDSSGALFLGDPRLGHVVNDVEVKPQAAESKEANNLVSDCKYHGGQKIST